MIQAVRPPRTAQAIALPYRPLWPVAAALIDRAPGVVFLDSAGPVTSGARWSILGWAPRDVFCWPTDTPGAFDALRARLTAERPSVAPPPGLPFAGGWIGWLAYDLARQIERLPAPPAPGQQDMALAEYDVVLLEDRQERRLYVAGTASEAELHARAREVDRLANCDGSASIASSVGWSEPCADLSTEAYHAAVRRILADIRAGDIYQANFAHRFTAVSDAAPQVTSAAIYAALRRASPAPYGAYLAVPGAAELLSVSPELFLRRRGDAVVTQPIKGTRPRDADPARDAALRDELRDSEKERAELLMIVDLLRNDLGRVAVPGSVRVETLRALVAHPTVHHAQAEITATLRPGTDAVDLLRATFPGGSVTGAPKIRAMEIIDELEPVRRGAYTGAAGYFGYNGDLCLNLLIRTVVRERERLHYHVGGAIVVDSDPAAEYAETLAKGRALHGALTAVLSEASEEYSE